MKAYRIKKIFGPTIQGEGSYLGVPVLFLRFSGCNKWNGSPSRKKLSVCYFCDTDFVGGEVLCAADIVERLQRLGDIKIVVVSGGEPTLQLDEALLLALKKADYEIHLETNGSKNIDHYSNLIDHISCSPKQSIDDTKLTACDDLKLLYPGLESVGVEAFLQAAKRGFCRKQVYIQPIVDISQQEDNVKKTVHKVISLSEKLFDVRISIQAHKYINIE